MKKKVLIVLGGNSREREVSIKTGKACMKAIRRLGYKTITFDPKKQSFLDILKIKVDIIFNALHGEEGEDGFAQSFFEFSKIPYTHSGVLASMKAMNKVISKEIFVKNKISTPRFHLIKKKQFFSKNIKNILIKKNLNFPVVIKPNSEGSSIGVKISKNLINLKKNINVLLKKFDTLLLEEFIGGQEVQVAVLNGKALGAIELKPKRKFYDYKAKYDFKSKTEHIIPVDLSKKNSNKVLNIALKAHKLLKCRGVTRSDFKFFRNKFYLLELNTQPGMTELSLVPEIAAFKGISFFQLLEWILNDASINR